jgi:hypothetical protein
VKKNEYFIRNDHVFYGTLISIVLVVLLYMGSNFISSYELDQKEISLSDITKSNSTNNNNYKILGNPFYTENTKSTNIKVTGIDPIPTVEVTYTGNSTIGGAPTQTIGTIEDKMNNDGSVSSKGQAIILTASGQVITYRLESVGTYNPDGSFSDSGVMVFHVPFKVISSNSTGLSSNSTDSLNAQFDNLFGIYKKTVDPEGNGLTKVWKWR